MIKNEICGLNYLDVVIRKGLIQSLGSNFPLTVGVEAAGIVEKLGAKVGSVAVGERVAFTVVGSGELNRYRGECHVCFFHNIASFNYSGSTSGSRKVVWNMNLVPLVNDWIYIIASSCHNDQTLN